MERVSIGEVDNRFSSSVVYFIGCNVCLLYTSTLEPGPHAGESIPARGPGRDFTAAERDSINRIGRETGCHTCGTTNPNTKGGNFIPDHQPPNALNPYNEPQRLYPHCSTCSRTQGGEIRTYQRRTRGVQE